MPRFGVLRRVAVDGPALALLLAKVADDVVHKDGLERFEMFVERRGNDVRGEFGSNLVRGKHVHKPHGLLGRRPILLGKAVFLGIVFEFNRFGALRGGCCSAIVCFATGLGLSRRGQLGWCWCFDNVVVIVVRGRRRRFAGNAALCETRDGAHELLNLPLKVRNAARCVVTLDFELEARDFEFEVHRGAQLP